MRVGLSGTKQDKGGCDNGNMAGVSKIRITRRGLGRTSERQGGRDREKMSRRERQAGATE